MLNYAVIILVSYLLGSVSTGLLVAKTNSAVNLREMGSKNTGASNVLRVMGMKAGLITFLGDLIKALLSCLLGHGLLGLHGAMLGGLFCILGHNWPVYYRFRGGKGVACSVAVFIATFPWPAGIISVVLCLLCIYLTRMISLGSMTMVVAFALAVSIQTGLDPLTVGWACLLAGICIFKHRSNIQRILKGTENKLGSKKK